MTKNPTASIIPSFKVNPINPLKEISSIDSSKYPTIESIGGDTKIRLHRLFGVQYMTNTLPTLLLMSRLVITDDFRGRFENILANHTKHLSTLHDETIRESEGAIVKALRMADDPSRYTHHIIPGSRGGMDVAGNYQQLDKSDHVVFHEVFSNLTPIEQIAHIILLFRNHYDPTLVVSICQLILPQNQTQNIHYKTDLLRHKKIEYPKGVGSFVPNPY